MGLSHCSTFAHITRAQGCGYRRAFSPSHLGSACARANVTDNVPLHVLGGNIVPMALGKQFMLTRDVRNASLALVVAFPAENSTMTGEAPNIRLQEERFQACHAPIRGIAKLCQ